MPYPDLSKVDSGAIELNPRFKKGERVKFVATPAAMMLYGQQPYPQRGEEGYVTTIAGSIGMRGPRGGLVYVDWDQVGTAGVFAADLERIGKGYSGWKVQWEGRDLVVTDRGRELARESYPITPPAHQQTLLELDLVYRLLGEFTRSAELHSPGRRNPRTWTTRLYEVSLEAPDGRWRNLGHVYATDEKGALERAQGVYGGLGGGTLHVFPFSPQPGEMGPRGNPGRSPNRIYLVQVVDADGWARDLGEVRALDEDAALERAQSKYASAAGRGELRVIKIGIEEEEYGDVDNPGFDPSKRMYGTANLFEVRVRGTNYVEGVFETLEHANAYARELRDRLNIPAVVVAVARRNPDEPPSWPPSDWVVEHIEATGDRQYPLRVIGKHLSGEPFRWSVPDVADSRYDLTHAHVDAAACPFLGRKANPPPGLTAKGARMYESVKAGYAGDPRAKEIAARTVRARSAEGARGLVRKPRKNQVPELGGDELEPVLDGAARAFWVASYADFAEEHRDDPDLERAGAGEDWVDVAPETPPAAYELASKFLNKLGDANHAEPTALVCKAAEADGAECPPGWDYAEAFGHYTAMQGMGHGVSWFDDHKEFPLKIPRFEVFAEDLVLRGLHQRLNGKKRRR